MIWLVLLGELVPWTEDIWVIWLVFSMLWNFCRKFNTSSCLYMWLNCLRKSTLDAMLYLEMIRFILIIWTSNPFYLGEVPKSSYDYIFLYIFFLFSFGYLRWRICLECSGSFLRYLEAWILFRIYLNRFLFFLYDLSDPIFYPGSKWIWGKMCSIFVVHFKIVYDLPSFMMQHVTAEGMALVKQAEDAASNKKVWDLIHFSLTIVNDIMPKMIFLFSSVSLWN